jgi:uncharacterized membrane protein
MPAELTLTLERRVLSNRLRAVLATPHALYTVIAAVFGLVFVFVTPPSGAGDEPRHFERMFEVATGHWLGAEGLPRGVLQFTDLSKTAVEESAKFDAEKRAELAAIPLDKGDVEPYPRPLEKVLRIHHPAAYLPFAPAVWTGLALDLPPASIFLLCKLTTLAFGVFLMRQAIRILPAFKFLAAFVALLPTTVFYLGAANIDAFLTGLGFLFFALVARAATSADGSLTGRDIALLAAVGAAVAAIKTPYALLPLSALLIPAAKFATPGKRLAALAIITLPGVALALSWALLAKAYFVPEGAYSTPGGTYVLPAEQLARLIRDPAAFLIVLWRTAFESSVPATTIGQALGLLGWNNVPLPAPTIALSLSALILLWFSGDAHAPPALKSAFGRTFCAGLFGAVVCASLFLLYLHWTGVGARTVEGFQGRYLLPIAPLLFALAPLRVTILDGAGRQAAFLCVCSSIGLASGVAAVFAHFY